MSLDEIMNQSTRFVRKNKSFCILVSAAVFAAFADTYMTLTYAESIQEEANPFMRYLWENSGVFGIVGAKISAVSLLGHQVKKTGESSYLTVPTIVYSIAALGWYFK